MTTNPLDPKSILKGQTTEDILARMKSSTPRVDTSSQTQQMIQAESFMIGPDDYSMFDDQQATDNLTKQVAHQFDLLGKRGYKYPKQGDVGFIQKHMVKDLRSAGIKDLRQLGYKEADVIMERTLIKKGDKYYINEPTEYYAQAMQYKLQEVNPTDVREIEVSKPIGFGQTSTRKVLKGKIKTGSNRVLINKETGEQVVQGKYGGVLGYGTDTDDPRKGLRWGNTTSVEGMADYMIAFDENDQAILFPKYADTATDLTGPMMVASIAMMGMGIPANIGTSLGLSGKAAVAAGNFLVEGTMSELAGGDFFKGGLSGAIKPYVGEYLDANLGKSIAESFGFSPDGTFSRIAGKAISRGAMGGIDALIFGGDVKDAIIKNAVAGGAEGLTVSAFENLIDPEDISLITDNTNLSYNDVMGLTSLSVRNGIFSVTQGGDFFDTFKETLLVHGVPTVVGNSIDSKFKARFADRPESYDLFKNTVLKLSSAYTGATLRGRPLTAEELKNIIVEQPIQQIFRKKVADPVKQTIQEQAINPLKEQAKNLFKRKKEEEEEV
tara:strand:- start:201 stop:1853 length:1653 start_codon:yes stop_codon:yes gene_type:complete